MIAEWEPEPLAPTEHPSDREVDPSPIVTGYISYMIIMMLFIWGHHCYCRTVGVHITVDGKKCINLATFNFLGFLGNTAIKVYTHPQLKSSYIMHNVMRLSYLHLIFPS